MSVIQRLRQNYDLVKKGIPERRDVTEKEQRELLYVEQKRLFAVTDDFLDRSLNEPYWLRQPEIAAIVANEIRLHDEKKFQLWSFCLMPNHVHLLLTLRDDAPVLYKVLQNIKAYSAQKANKLLVRRGAILGNGEL